MRARSAAALLLVLVIVGTVLALIVGAVLFVTALALRRAVG